MYGKLRHGPVLLGPVAAAGIIPVTGTNWWWVVIAVVSVVTVVVAMNTLLPYRRRMF
jgi:cell division protein FtsW (lipid II flippase)